MTDKCAQLVRRCLRVVNSGGQPLLRDLRLVCSDGALTWNALFLAPVLSNEMRWECEVALRDEDQSSLSLLLPDFSVSSARKLLEVVTSGAASVSSEEGRREVTLLLRSLGADLAMFSGVDQEELSSESSDGEDLQEGKEAEYVVDEEGKEEEEEAKMELWDEEEEDQSEINATTAKKFKRNPSDKSPCPFCTFECLHLSTLINHVSRMHFKSQLLQQMEDHGMERKKKRGWGYRCPECGKQVKTRDLLAMHWGATHRRVLDFLHGENLTLFHPLREKNAPQIPIRETRCPLCKSAFSTVSFLKQHLSGCHFATQIRTVLEKEGRAHGCEMRCPECGKEAAGRRSGERGSEAGNLVMHYGSRHGRVLDFADEKLRRWLEGLGIRRQ